MTYDEGFQAGRKTAEGEIAEYVRSYLEKLIEHAPMALRYVLRTGVDKLCDAIKDGACRDAA